MYTKQEASRLRQEFWTSFGHYMRPVMSSEGERVNWINYRTGVPGITFKMDADDKQASIAIIISHADLDSQQRVYDQFLQLKKVLQDETGEQWTWEYAIEDSNDNIICRISATLDNVNIFNNADWPKLISFFKPRLMGFDAFWNMAKPGFEYL